MLPVRSRKNLKSNNKPSKDAVIYTYALGLFVVIYLAFLVILSPLLLSSNSEGVDVLALHVHGPGRNHLRHQINLGSSGGAHFTTSDEFMKQQHPHKNAWSMGYSLEEELLKIKDDSGSSNNSDDVLLVQNADTPTHKVERHGFMVLGMHRSGTSMLAGLLYKGLGYTVGPERLLIQPSFDNKRGFFERVDAVLQNDAFMHPQGISYASNVIAYDPEKALKGKESGAVVFKEGEKALKFLNNPRNRPWIQKDPRMCITLKTWLPLLDAPPAAVFSYRHPLEVAKSMEKRDGATVFPISRGLRLWIVYNMRAIQNSENLCRVMTSNESLMTDTKNEIRRIGEGLAKCGLPPPKEVQQAVVDEFVDPNLRLDNSDLFTEELVERHGDCIVLNFESKHAKGTREKEYEFKLYKIATKIYCDLKSGAAYRNGYDWPKLP